MLLCRQASMSNHGEEKITPKRRKRKRCIAEESSSSNSDWGSAHPDREPESDRGARSWCSEWLSSTTPPSSWPTSGSRMWPAMTPGCARWSWSTTTWIWRSAIRLQRPLAEARLGFVWWQQWWRRRPDLRSLSVCRHHLQLGLWHPTALQHRQVTVWLSEFAAFWALNPACWCGWYR